MTVKQLFEDPAAQAVIEKRITKAVKSERARVLGVIKQYIDVAKTLPKGEVRTTLLDQLKGLQTDVKAEAGPTPTAE